MSDTLFDVDPAQARPIEPALKLSTDRRRTLRAGTRPLGLFSTNAETGRIVDGLTCLRDSMPSAMYVVVHLADWRIREERGAGCSGDWAYAIRRDGLRIERAKDWRGWDHAPAHRIAWAELAEQLGGDSRRAELIAWSESLAEPAWQEMARPYELWPEPEKWHPHYIEGDHERPGWDQRITAWRTLQAILTDAMEGAST